MATPRRFLVGLVVGVLSTLCVLSLLVIIFAGDASPQAESLAAAPTAMPDRPPHGGDAHARAERHTCSEEGAEVFLQAHVATLSPMGDGQLMRVSWQAAGACSWLVSGVGGWQDPLSKEVVSQSFSAAVSGENGRYRLDMFDFVE